jgi:peptidoglycan biosynthesis protein MviN/MurJ (putative lipid II flippase)
MIVSFFEVFLNVVLSLLLLRWFGLAGIALATLIAFSLSKAYLSYYVSRYLGKNINEYIDFRLYIVYSAVLIASFLIISII